MSTHQQNKDRIQHDQPYPYNAQSSSQKDKETWQNKGNLFRVNGGTILRKKLGGLARDLGPGPEAKGRRQRCDPIGRGPMMPGWTFQLVEVCLLGVRDC